MKKAFRLSCLLTLALAACASPKYEPTATTSPQTATFASRASVAITWETVPTETDFGAFQFETYKISPVDGTKVPTDLGNSVNVLLWMPSMGHGSSPVTVEHLGIGQYRAANVFFIMKGAWEIHFQVKSANATADEAVLAYTF